MEAIMHVIRYLHTCVYTMPDICTCLLLCYVRYNSYVTLHSLASKFTCSLEQFTHTHIELLIACALLPTRNLCKIIR